MDSLTQANQTSKSNLGVTILIIVVTAIIVGLFSWGATSLRIAKITSEQNKTTTQSDDYSVQLNGLSNEIEGLKIKISEMEKQEKEMVMKINEFESIQESRVLSVDDMTTFIQKLVINKNNSTVSIPSNYNPVKDGGNDSQNYAPEGTDFIAVNVYLPNDTDYTDLTQIKRFFVKITTFDPICEQDSEDCLEEEVNYYGPFESTVGKIIRY